MLLFFLNILILSLKKSTFWLKNPLDGLEIENYITWVHNFWKSVNQVNAFTIGHISTLMTSKLFTVQEWVCAYFEADYIYFIMSSN